MELKFQGYVEKVDASTPCVRLERIFPGETGFGISSMVIETIETTPDAAFWGTASTCQRFVVIVRKVG